MRLLYVVLALTLTALACYAAPPALVSAPPPAFPEKPIDADKSASLHPKKPLRSFNPFDCPCGDKCECGPSKQCGCSLCGATQNAQKSAEQEYELWLTPQGFQYLPKGVKGAPLSQPPQTSSGSLLAGSSSIYPAPTSTGTCSGGTCSGPNCQGGSCAFPPTFGNPFQMQGGCANGQCPAPTNRRR